MRAIKKPAKKTNPVTYPWDISARFPRNTHSKKHYVSYMEWISPSGLPSATYVVSDTPLAGKKILEDWWFSYFIPQGYGTQSRKMPKIHTGTLPKAVYDQIEAADEEQYSDLWNDRGIMKNKYVRQFGDISDKYGVDIGWLLSIPYNKAVVHSVKQSARRKGRRIR